MKAQVDTDCASRLLPDASLRAKKGIGYLLRSRRCTADRETDDDNWPTDASSPAPDIRRAADALVSVYRYFTDQMDLARGRPDAIRRLPPLDRARRGAARDCPVQQGWPTNQTWTPCIG